MQRIAAGQLLDEQIIQRQRHRAAHGTGDANDYISGLRLTHAALMPRHDKGFWPIPDTWRRFV
jgi:hypothetical protein